jgi:hypothetical protein
VDDKLHGVTDHKVEPVQERWVLEEMPTCPKMKYQVLHGYLEWHKYRYASGQCRWRGESTKYEERYESNASNFFPQNVRLH